MESTSIQNGWVIVNDDGRIVDFTFSRLRVDAQQKWVDLWDKPNNWKAHYKKGVRCVKAQSIIKL